MKKIEHVAFVDELYRLVAIVIFIIRINFCSSHCNSCMLFYQMFVELPIRKPCSKGEVESSGGVIEWIIVPYITEIRRAKGDEQGTKE